LALIPPLSARTAVHYIFAVPADDGLRALAGAAHLG
jgi:hypothetical protein